MKKDLWLLAVVGLALALSRDAVSLGAAGAALLMVVAGGYSRRTHF